MDLLYHYTSLSGLLGIVQSRGIWATHASYLNDASEFFHAVSFAKQEANAVYMDDDYLAAFGWAARKALENVAPGNLFTASFSRQADLLSQWRGYCPSGAGVCLGFDKAAVVAFCLSNGYRLEPCLYDHSSQVERVRNLVTKSLERFPPPAISRQAFDALQTSARVAETIDYHERTATGAEAGMAAEATHWLSTQLLELAPLFKNQGFNEEAEWRIIAREPALEIKYRAAASYLIPYVHLELLSTSGLEMLREVIIGPNANQHRCAKSVRELLTSTRLNDVDVRRSPLPFNVW